MTGFYRNTLFAKASSMVLFPDGAHTCWFHCRFRSVVSGREVGCILREVGAELCGMSAAKLLTVVRMRFTAAEIRADNSEFEMCADSKSAGRFWLRLEMTF